MLSELLNERNYLPILSDINGQAVTKDNYTD